ncbi:conjugal transfer protein TraR [Hydrogenimonas sp. SS33]|uniref:TraR/DksA family transcriptional regulator n=1 Tax=Hydrogenimonas leucolamina TaxID=2954236 RepID=UPI00336BC6DE
MAYINTEYFKKRLEEERERILRNIEAVNAELATIAAEDEIDDIEDMAELKVDNDRDKEVLKILLQELKDVNDALKKIAEGTYGLDEKTGRPIPINRLLANPAARTA